MGWPIFKLTKPLRPDSPFRLASVSKPFTAIAIMMLKERGQLDYEDNINKYLPKLPYKGITIRHLLHHTSGIPDYAPLLRKHWVAREEGSTKRKIATNKDALRVLERIKPPLQFHPGSRFSHCNTGYAPLALVVEKVDGIPFGEFLQTQIFRPLKMNHSWLYNSKSDSKMKHRVFGFARIPDGSGLVPNDRSFLNGMYGDGGIFTTTRDLLKWDRALYSESLVSDQTLQEAFTSGTLNDGALCGYGFGWKITEDRHGHKVVSHQGGWLGFKALMERKIEGKWLVVILTNDTNQNFDAIRKAIGNILQGKIFKVPKPPVTRMLGKTIATSGIDQTKKRYDILRAENFSDFDFGWEQFDLLGRYYIQEKKYNYAVAVLELAVLTHTENHNALNALGRAYVWEKQPVLAIKMFKKSIQLNPGKSNDAYLMLNKLRKKAPPAMRHLFEKE